MLIHVSKHKGAQVTNTHQTTTLAVVTFALTLWSLAPSFFGAGAILPRALGVVVVVFGVEAGGVALGLAVGLAPLLGADKGGCLLVALIIWYYSE
jgi:hypothetical protein